MASSSSSAPPPAPSPPLFTVPIAPLLPSHPGGSITCTEPYPRVYLLTFCSPPDNRLTSPFCTALLRALDLLEFGTYDVGSGGSGSPPGVVVTTSAIAKFYSNGLDLEHATSTPGYWEGQLYELFLRFLTFPWPTVALLNGHAFAGGLMLAMHHDYRVMNPSRGYACLNELDFGAPLKAPMSGIFRIKTTPAAYRSLVLEARRFTGPDAKAAGIVDDTGGLDAVARLVADRCLITKGDTGIYGLLKREMYRENVDLLSPESHRREENRHMIVVQEDDDDRRRRTRRRTVEGDEEAGKAKL